MMDKSDFIRLIYKLCASIADNPTNRRLNEKNGNYNELNRATIIVNSDRLDNLLPDLCDRDSTLVWISDPRK